MKGRGLHLLPTDCDYSTFAFFPDLRYHSFISHKGVYEGLGKNQRTRNDRGATDMGVMVSPVAPPAVKKGTARIRVAVMPTHTHFQLDKALDAFKRVEQELNTIS